MKNALLLLFIGCLLSSCSGFSNASKHIENTEPEYVIQDTFLITGFYRISNNNECLKRTQLYDTATYYVIPTPVISVKHFKSIEMAKGYYGHKVLSLQFDKMGTDLWFAETTEAQGEKIAVIVNDTLISAPRVNEAIPVGRASLDLGPENEIKLQQFKSDIEKEMEKYASRK
ncbi:MAG TPA: hypothetical protein PK511_10280 [Chitinophagales bacterium]|nr:hypothetical protein [Chitinophagales bacterium]HNK96868.1 hypothetical protein [Chitinophagales bacterium]HNM07412.1 hypothetical protein [Chitinophagales bacterium]